MLLPVAKICCVECIINFYHDKSHMNTVDQMVSASAATK